MDQAAPAADGTPSLDGAREEFLSLLLQRFETGAFDAYEYSRRVRAIELAPTLPAMADVVDAPVADEPKLDPVDMLLLSRATPTRPRRTRGKPTVLLVVVGVFFIVLLAVGMWLVSHARALQNSGNLGMRPAAASVVTPAGAPSPGAPLS